MKQLSLSQNKLVNVDDEDFEALSEYKWCAKWDAGSNTFYAVRHTPRPEHKTVIMHRVLMGANSFSEKVDHIDHNGLNNCKVNLRLCSNSLNQQNRSKQRKATSSIYKGVCWEKRRSKWQVSIMLNKKSIFIGYFDDEKDAALAYNNKAKSIFGDFALLNLI